MIKLYHSSTVEVKKPLVEIGRKKVDFGQGFYMTRMRSQAERWAKAVAGRSPNATPVLNVYQFDMDKAKMIAGRRYRNFDRYDREWLEYVIDSRRGGKLQQKYDLVEGGVANDNVIDTVEDYENGVITAEQALGQLAYRKVNHQICIHSQKIVDECVRFVEAKKLQGGQP